MTARDLFNFVYDNPEKRNLMLSLMTVVECYEKGRGVRFYHGFENPEKISLSDFEKSVADGYYLYFKYAHFDDEIFYWYESLNEALSDYRNENIHKRLSLIMEKRLIKVTGKEIEQLEMDKWKDKF